jgi:hypothetical protein
VCRHPPFSSLSEGATLHAPTTLEELVELAHLGYPLL